MGARSRPCRSCGATDHRSPQRSSSLTRRQRTSRPCTPAGRPSPPSGWQPTRAPGCSTRPPAPRRQRPPRSSARRTASSVRAPGSASSTSPRPATRAPQARCPGPTAGSSAWRRRARRPAQVGCRRSSWATGTTTGWTTSPSPPRTGCSSWRTPATACTRSGTRSTPASWCDVRGDDNKPRRLTRWLAEGRDASALYDATTSPGVQRRGQRDHRHPRLGRRRLGQRSAGHRAPAALRRPVARLLDTAAR